MTEAEGLGEAAWEGLIYNHEIVTPIAIVQGNVPGKEFRQEIRDTEEIRRLLLI